MFFSRPREGRCFGLLRIHESNHTPFMKKKSVSESGAFNPRIFATFVLCAFAAVLSLMSFATTPPNGTISDSTTSVTYTGGPFTVPTNAADNASGPVTCDTAHPCDDFPLH